MPMTPEMVAKAPPCDMDEAEAAAKRERKAAKRAAKEAAADTAAPNEETDEAEAKRQRKAAKKAAKEAAAAAETQVAPVEEVDEVEAKKLRKAAKKAAKEAAAAAETQEAPVEEVDEVEAKRLRKAAKKAAKEAAAAAESVEAPPVEKDAPETPVKRAVETAEDDDEAPKAKKSRVEDEEVGAGKGVVDENKSLKVFVKGLPYSVEEAALRKDFAECGEIVQLQLPLNEEGTPKGFAFIQFATEAGFDAALKYDNTDYGGRYINVSKANDSGKGKGKDAKGKGKSKGKAGDWNCPNPECGDLVFGRNSECRKCGTARPEGVGGEVSAPPVRDNTNTVFVRGLPWSVSEEALRKDFTECGEIENLNFPLNEEGKPKGIAFIKYKNEAGLEAALKFDNTDYGGRTIFVAKAGEGKGKGKDGKGKDGKGKGKDSKGKAKGKSKGKGKAPSEAKAKNTGCIVEGAGEKTTFADSDDE